MMTTFELCTLFPYCITWKNVNFIKVNFANAWKGPPATFQTNPVRSFSFPEYPALVLEVLNLMGVFLFLLTQVYPTSG